LLIFIRIKFLNLVIKLKKKKKNQLKLKLFAIICQEILNRNKNIYNKTIYDRIYKQKSNARLGNQKNNFIIIIRRKQEYSK
jgi:hypothetical protein